VSKEKTHPLKQRHQDTEDRLKAEAEVRQQQASERDERVDAALKREHELVQERYRG